MHSVKFMGKDYREVSRYVIYQQEFVLNKDHLIWGCICNQIHHCLNALNTHKILIVCRGGLYEQVSYEENVSTSAWAFDTR